MSTYRVGAMRDKITIEKPVETVDTFGAPKRTWTPVLQCWAARENEQYESGETIQAPYEQARQSITFVIRNHFGHDLDTRCRIKDDRTGAIYAVSAIRHDTPLKWLFIDGVSGGSDG